jgi:hypothetical protein
LRRVLLLLLLAACAEKETRVQTIDVPFRGAVPYVSRDGVISYIDEQTRAFRVVTYRDGKWSEPRTIAADESMLINRADFPSVEANGDTLIAAWSTRREHGSVVHVAQSRDGGATWSAPKTPHPDLISQFGFVALAGDQFVYLDGRTLKGGMEGEGDMQLRAGDGSALDTRVCDCCQTALAMTGEGPIAAYRDRSAEEIRDISIVRRTAGGWTQPKPLHDDGWKIAGCPVNGPQLDAKGKTVVAAWFTAANNDSRVLVAFSGDAGATFSRPIRVDSGPAIGRADVVLLGDGAAAVTWMTAAGEKSVLHARRVEPDGTLGKAHTLGEAAGFPRAALWDDNVAVVWSRPDGIQVRVIERL